MSDLDYILSLNVGFMKIDKLKTKFEFSIN